MSESHEPSEDRQPEDDTSRDLQDGALQRKAAIGRWVLILVIGLIALSELGLLGVALSRNQIKIGQLGRICFTFWLVVEIWNGTAWARWVVAGLLVAAGAAMPIMMYSVDEQKMTSSLFWMGVLVPVVCLSMAALLASPWVGAYQKVKKLSNDSE